MTGSTNNRPRVIIIGGGFGGLNAAKGLKKSPVDVFLLDKHNYHLFQPLLYQVATARVLLIHGGDRLLPMMPKDLSRKVQRELEKMGAEIRLNNRVTDVTAEGVMVGEKFVAANNVFWAAGVEGQSFVHSMDVELDRAGRVIVGSDMSIPGYPNAFVVGDAASAPDAKTGERVPGMAQGAIQTGSFVAKIIADEVRAGSPQERLVFSYFDKGSMAAVGRGKAVAAVGKIHLSGFLGFLSWAMLHLLFLVGFGRKVMVGFGWITNYFSHERQARLIVGDSQLDLKAVQIGTLTGDQDSDEQA